MAMYGLMHWPWAVGPANMYNPCASASKLAYAGLGQPWHIYAS